MNLIIPNKKKLVHLDLAECHLPNRASIEVLILSNLDNLMYLNLSRVENLNIAATIKLTWKYKTLKHFNFLPINEEVSLLRIS